MCACVRVHFCLINHDPVVVVVHVCPRQEFNKMRDRLVVKEKILLQTVGFHLCVELPFSAVGKACYDLSRQSQCVGCCELHTPRCQRAHTLLGWGRAFAGPK